MQTFNAMHACTFEQKLHFHSICLNFCFFAAFHMELFHDSDFCQHVFEITKNLRDKNVTNNNDKAMPTNMMKITQHQQQQQEKEKQMYNACNI